VIELACIAEGGYLRHTGAMLHSVLAHTENGSVSVNILHVSEIEAAERENIQHVIEARGAALRFLRVGPEDIASLPAGYFSAAVWLRIFLPQLLPHLDKVLYLDSDLIVADDLKPLWDTELGGGLLAAVVNPTYPFMPLPYPQKYLGLEATEYFNSGVLLMNLGLMRQQGATAQLREFALAHPEIPCPDQDALNVVCRGNWLKLHPRWNIQSPVFDLKPEQLPYTAAHVAESLKAPAIIHYTGPSKPWHYLCRHHHQKLYFQHAAATPWGEPAIEGASLRTIILKRLPLSWTFRLAMAEYALRRMRRGAKSANLRGVSV
jgi:lipopolysaccharide biosynthesis glycosyltransferase